MNTFNKSFILSAGLAIFSMLFGAGNVVYPLLAGTFAQDKYVFTILGFLVSSVLFGFLGTISIMLFEGDFSKFFAKLGKVPGFLLTIFIMCLIGPFGAMPRIVCVAFGSMKNIFPNMHLISFSLITCLLTFFFTLKRKRILDILGYVLTPMLLVSLFSLIVVGLFKISSVAPSDFSNTTAIAKGFSQGNQTMDLFGALCFSSMVYNIFRKKTDSKEIENKKILSFAIKASSIGLFLLALIYVSFITLSAFYSNSLTNLSGTDALGVLTTIILGAKASYISSIIVALACLTTAIALCNVFTDFVHEKLFKKKTKYVYCLIGSLLITFLFSTLNFEGITNILNPILAVIYPSLIVLSALNILHKLYGFKMVRGPVFLTFLITLALKLFI